MADAIVCDDLRRVYPGSGGKEAVALDALNLSVPPGTVFGLLGPNGAGKTTTVRILSTLLTPTSGNASVLGYDVMKQTAQVRDHIGFILGGDRGLYGRLTGQENLEYFAALNHIENRIAQPRIEELLKLVGLFERKDDLVEKYSRGMKQRVHIARGLLTDPDVVFMDEPTIGLDPIGAQEIRAVIPQLAAQGKTVLLTTHYMFEADFLCETIALMNKGNIVAQGSPSDIKNKVSQITVVELLLRELPKETINEFEKIPDIVSVHATQDGLLQRIVLHAKVGTDTRSVVASVLGDKQVESFVEREPTLEEAYLTILG